MLWQGPGSPEPPFPPGRRVLPRTPIRPIWQTLAILLESGRFVPFIESRLASPEVPEAITALESAPSPGGDAIRGLPPKRGSGKESSDRTERAACSHQAMAPLEWPHPGQNGAAGRASGRIRAQYPC